jgi:hypothetical protein
MKLSRRILGIAVALAGWCGGSHANEMRALLVGVSEYPDLPGHSLEGPRNDVARMRELLVRRHFAADHIVVLSDGVADSTLPTRANILAALDRLGEQARRGDFVLVYLAGHGSQEPAFAQADGARAKSDGLAEVFLPRDAHDWALTDDGGLAHIPNAILDSEIRDRVDRITARGAFVWGIFDSCHSATLVRGGADGAEVRYRTVAPGELGVPIRLLDEAADAQARKVPVAMPAAARDAGGSAFFYAAQTTQEAPEMRLPVGDADRKSFGLFGYTLMQALDRGLPMSYRQLGQYVLNQYGAMNLGRRPPTPLFSGTQLDTAVLGQESVQVQQWRVEPGATPSVAAGALSQIDPGSLFAIVAQPLDGDAAALAYATAGNVALAATTLNLVAHDGKAAPDPRTLPPGAWARLLHRVPHYALRVAVDAGDCGAHCVALSAIRQLQNDGVEGAQIEWLADSGLADVTLRPVDDVVLLVPPALQGVHCESRPAAAERLRCREEIRRGSLVLGDAARQTIATALHRVARATNLMRLAAQRQPVGAAGQLKVQMSLTPHVGAKRLLTPEQVPALRADDIVDITLTNAGRSPLDLTVLYLDSTYGISTLYPESGASNRLAGNSADGTAQAQLQLRMNDDTLGLERVMIIAVETTELGERADFSFLAQPAVEQSGTRGNAAREDDDMTAFRDAGFATYATRGAPMVVPKAPSVRTTMVVFNWDIVR